MLYTRSLPAFPTFPAKATLAAAAALLLAAGCSSNMPMSGDKMAMSPAMTPAMVDNMSLPEPVRVPAGQALRHQGCAHPVIVGPPDPGPTAAERRRPQHPLPPAGRPV